MEKYGVFQLYEGEDPQVDIVAVHGLNGDAYNTWTTKVGTCWLKDSKLLPKAVKNSRIMTFGYNANATSFMGSTSSDRILQHAQTLVAQLEADRALADASRRPLIFICHSLGGIIVKRALAYSASRTSKKIAHLHSICFHLQHLISGDTSQWKQQSSASEHRTKTTRYRSSFQGLGHRWAIGRCVERRVGDAPEYHGPVRSFDEAVPCLLLLGARENKPRNVVGICC